MQWVSTRDPWQTVKTEMKYIQMQLEEGGGTCI